MSQEYIASIVIVLASLAKILGLDIQNDAIEGIVVGSIAIWIAVRRYKKGDINVLGARK